MAALRSGIFARRLATVPSPAASRIRPLISTWNPLQRRFQTTDAKENPYQKGENVGGKRFKEFDLAGKVFVVTGAASSSGGRGLGLCMAEGLIEAGGKVHCLDISPEPDAEFKLARERIDPTYGGGLEYHQVDVTDAEKLRNAVEQIAAERERLDGLIAAAAIQQCTPALDYAKADISRMLETNYTGVFLSARECARQMHRYKIPGSICLIASMSGLIANRGFIAPVYNSSKAAVIQLTRNLAMEWGRVNKDGSGGIRVNSISPGHIMTPMVEENFKRGEANKEEWENNNMLGRLSSPEEYKAAGLFLLSRASSYMWTGANLVMDGGTTSW